MVSSNPSPRYVKAVATAFATGWHANKKYSGQYGDMAATIAAVMLDREARDTTLELDPGHGQLREPLLKVLHVLRSLDFKSVKGVGMHLAEMPKRIGQMAHFSPGVFNFYLPEFVPAGTLERSGLVSPESQILTTPFLIGYLNGMNSLIDYGLTNCDSGFGSVSVRASLGLYGGACSLGARRAWPEHSDGLLQFKPTNPSNPDKVVAELALVMTGGRLSARTEATLTAAYGSFLGEAPLNITAMRQAEQDKDGPRGIARCSTITNKQDCCDFKDNYWLTHWANAPNCVPGDYADGTVCQAEQKAGYKEGDKMELCGKQPLASGSKAGQFGAFRVIDGKYGQPYETPGAHHGQSCLAQSRVTDAYVQLDLGVKKHISSVTLHNRIDVAGEDNKGISVYIDGKLCAQDIVGATGSIDRIPCSGSSPLGHCTCCAVLCVLEQLARTVTTRRQGRAFTLLRLPPRACGAVHGQVIKVMRKGTNKALSFCELEVNVHVRHTIDPSSTFQDAVVWCGVGVGVGGREERWAERYRD